MRKKLLLFAAFLLLPAALFATDSAHYFDVAFSPSGKPIAGASIRVCTEPATTTPCTPLATIYSDYALTTPLANPFLSSSTGNYEFYAVSSEVAIEVSFSGYTTVIRHVALRSLSTPVTPGAVAGGLYPSVDAAYDLGTLVPLRRWLNFYAVAGNFTTANIAGDLAVVGDATVSSLNKVCKADGKGGANAGEKIQACHDALPITGGTIDARGLTDAQSAAAQINITKPNITLELSPTTVLTLASGVGSTSGMYVTWNNVSGPANNFHLLCNGATIKATRALESVAFDEYYLVRVTALNIQHVDGFVSDTCNYELTVTGALATAAQMGGIKLESTATTRFVKNWSIRHNKFNTQAPDIGITHRWYGAEASPASMVANTRVFFDGKFEFNECLGDGRCLQVSEGRNISWIGNQARNPSQGNQYGGVQFRAIGVDNAVFTGNSCLVDTGDSGAACIYIGGNATFANDESKGFSITGNVAKYDTVQLTSDTYGVNILGARDGTISGNTFVNTQAGAGGASDGIKVQAATALVNKNINISSNRIVGFLGYEILVSDTTPPEHLTAQGNHLGDSAAGGANDFGGAGIANLKRYGNYSEAAGTWTPINTVTFSATPTFDASLGNTQKITLTDNVTSSTLSNATAGQQIDFLICQDGTGSRTFVWPTNVLGGMTIGSTLSKCSAQSFRYDGTLTNAYALSAGVTNM
jgi:hypothetical protein